MHFRPRIATLLSRAVTFDEILGKYHYNLQLLLEKKTVLFIGSLKTYWRFLGFWSNISVRLSGPFDLWCWSSSHSNNLSVSWLRVFRQFYARYESCKNTSVPLKYGLFPQLYMKLIWACGPEEMRASKAQPAYCSGEIFRLPPVLLLFKASSYKQPTGNVHSIPLLLSYV